MTTDAVPLKEHFEALLRDMEKRNEQRFDAQEKAVLKAEVATEKRLEGVNEFRKTLGDQQDTFVRKDVADARFASADARIEAISTLLAETKGRGAGRNDIWLIIVAVASPAISLAIALATIFFKH